MVRKIIHIDMDCFYAAIEIRDNSLLRGKPVAVGGLAEKRGVLSTCNYEARRYGLHSAMPTAKAFQLCPKLILLLTNMEKYKAASSEIHAIFRQYTAVIESLSLDEAYLDVSDSTLFKGSATLLAQHIRQEIFSKVKLHASAGIAPNKFLAKVASDWNKPNGQFVVAPHEVVTFIQQLPVKKVPGVGKVTEKKLRDMNIHTCGQLQTLSSDLLMQAFGKFGGRLYDYSRGVDSRPVETERIRKSVSVETTFLNDTVSPQFCEEVMRTLYQRLEYRLRQYQDCCVHKQFIKIKFSDFTVTTKECLVSSIKMETFAQLFYERLNTSRKKVRLLGLGVRFGKHTANIPKQEVLW